MNERKGPIPGRSRPGSRPSWIPVVGVLAVVASGLVGWRLLRPSREHHPALPPGLETVGQRPSGPPAPIPEAWAEARAQVAETMKTAPEKLSPNAPLEPFDREEFQNDPAAYLARIEPSRCFQTAKPGPEAVALDVGSPLRTHVVTGDATLLWVKTLPRAPVTFTVFGGGFFKENGVGTVSVRADANGLAGAHYMADAGIVGDVSVIAGSPVAVGTQRFFIRIDQSVVTAKL
jgi:hypothetical protein